MADGTDTTKGNGTEPKRGRGRPRKALQTAKTSAEAAAKVQARIDEYAQDFDTSSLTAVDWQGIRNLATLEISAQSINDKLAQHAAGSLELSALEVKALADAAKIFIAEARQQANALGIDRRTRMSSAQSELEMYLPKVAEEARKLLYGRCIAIVCLDCRKSEAQVDIRTGFMLYHLFDEDKEWSATFRCQREVCGKLFTVNHANWRDYRMEAVDKAKSDKEMKEDEENA